MTRTPSPPDDPHAAENTHQAAENGAHAGPRQPFGAPIGVIGAGSSGLAAVKALKEAGLPVVAFELGSRVGGLWVFDSDSQRSAAYRSLRINTSRTMTQFSDFPMPKDWDDFPGHEQIAEYFQAYAEHFDLTRHVRFRTEVLTCQEGDTGYLITTKNLTSGEVRKELFAAVLVCNGHHWSPAYPHPDPRSEFEGIVTHSFFYKDRTSPHDLTDKRVLVVGMGNSSMDIACELSQAGGARKVSVSARRGAWVIPRYILGRPLDQGTWIPTWLPERLRRKLVTRAFVWLFGRMEDYGLMKPDHLIGEAHPTVSSDFPRLVREGKIEARSAIEGYSGAEVRFVDGSRDHFDALIFCTGYNVSFPFFDQTHLPVKDNRLDLYHRAFHPSLRRVFFVGLAQTLGAIMPVAEAQARAIAAHLVGEYNLPTEKDMRAAIKAEESRMAARFVATKRHTMQVDPPRFLRTLERDLKAGMKRRRKNEGIAFPPFPSHVDEEGSK